MRQAVFYDPDDFEVPASEQFLAIHQGYGSSHRTDLGSSFSMLLFEMQVETFSDQAGNVLPASPEFDLKEWQEQAHNLLSLPIQPPSMDLLFVRRGWLVQAEWNDLVLIGEGQGCWIVLHWHTTA